MIDCLDSTFVYPTDTVWGIGGSIYSKRSFEYIARVKNVTTNKPLSVMFSSIEMLKEYISLPDIFSDEWLKSFFLLETSLLVSKKMCFKEIPKWITSGSDFVSIRCVDNLSIRDIIESVKAPITSTSLNMTGSPPITNYSDALDFKEKYATDAIFRNSQKHNLSGESSTLVKFVDFKNIEILRVGRNHEKVKELFKLLPA